MADRVGVRSLRSILISRSAENGELFDSSDGKAVTGKGHNSFVQTEAFGQVSPTPSFRGMSIK